AGYRERRNSAEVRDLVGRRREVRPGRPLETGALEQDAVDGDLEAAVLDRADVRQLLVQESLRRRVRHLEQCVTRALEVGRQLDADAVVPQPGIEAELELLRAL